MVWLGTEIIAQTGTGTRSRNRNHEHKHNHDAEDRTANSHLPHKTGILEPHEPNGHDSIDKATPVVDLEGHSMITPTYDGFEVDVFGFLLELLGSSTGTRTGTRTGIAVGSFVVLLTLVGSTFLGQLLNVGQHAMQGRRKSLFGVQGRGCCYCSFCSCCCCCCCRLRRSWTWASLGHGKKIATSRIKRRTRQGRGRGRGVYSINKFLVGESKHSPCINVSMDGVLRRHRRKFMISFLVWHKLSSYF